MNSLYNHALKQFSALERDLGKFQTGEDTSVALQGTASTIGNNKLSLQLLIGQDKRMDSSLYFQEPAKRSALCVMEGPGS